MRASFMLVVVAAGLLAFPAAATVVASTLPYQNTPDWTDVLFGGTSMTSNGSVSTLATGPGVGVWFGWAAGGDQPPWSPASNAAGNYLDLSFSLTAGARDWSAYFYDGSRYAYMNFNPTNCNGNLDDCAIAPYLDGVNIYFVDQSNDQIETFIPLNLNQTNRVEFLLKGSQVDYRINGQRYTGTAGESGSQILVIGDGSASTLTGSGSMLITAVSFDAAPAFSELPSTVPEPASWAMLIAGIGLVGATLRRRHAALRTVLA